MIRYRGWFFLLAVLTFIVAWPLSEQLHLDRSLERMFPSNDPDRMAFERLEDRFGVSRFLVFAYRDQQLWDASGHGIQRAKDLRTQLESIEGVRYALDVSRIDDMLSTLRGPSMLGAFTGKPKFHPLLDDKDPIAVQYKRMFEGQTHANDTDLVAIGVLLDSDRTSEAIASTLTQLRQLANSTPDGMLVGHLAMVDEGFREIEQDGQRLAIYSTLSLTLFMLIGFRSLRWALIIIVVVQWSLVVTRAVLVLLDWELTMVSSMLSSIVMVVGVATTMHWMFGYHRQFESDHSSVSTKERALRAMQSSLSSLWWPITWACVTDAIGFGSLMLSRVGPVQDYGSMMAVACSVVLVGIFSMVPTLALWGPNLSAAKHASFWFRVGDLPGEAWLQQRLQSLLKFVLARRLMVLGTVSLVTLVAVMGATRLRVETDFLKNFHTESPISRAYHAVETELGGAGVWDVTVPAPATITPEYFSQVQDLTIALLSIEVPSLEPKSQAPLRLTSALSLADTDRVASSSALLRVVPIEGRLFGMRQSMGTFFDTLLAGGEGDRCLRIMLRARERSESQQKVALIDKVQSVLAEHMDRPYWKELRSLNQTLRSSTSREGNATESYGAAGYYVLLTRLVEHVVADQWLSFAVATMGIGLAMAIALRNLRLAIAGLVPAVLPNLVVLGVLGWNGTAVNLGAAMIAAVSMGLGIDSSLHYLFRYRRERELGASGSQALRIAQSETGLAVLMATLALIVGFGSMAFSNFLPTAAFGTLAAWTMLGGLIGNLCILPAIVSWLDP